MQVNGTSSVSDQFKVGNFLPGGSASSSGATIITQGQVRAAGGFNLRDSINGDNTFNGMKIYGNGPALWSGNAAVLSASYVRSNASGSHVSILGGFIPTTGNGIVNGLDFASATILMLSGSNSIGYNFINLGPGVRSEKFRDRHYTGIV
jgi:hypothetical protein